ncbi:MAG: redoxin domain-containing protein [Clostridiales bacterium]|nr:redoxin domain-containing protein [Clostridiales bacterium]
MAKKWSAWWAAHKPTKRRLIQVYAALLYNAHIKGFIKGDIYVGPTKNICVPGFNCYSCPGAIGACPLGALQNALASADKRAPWYVLGILMLYGLTLGRTICGWICPLGLIQELFHKLPTPKLPKGRVTHALSYLKYILIGLFVVGIPLAYSVQRFPVPGFCKYICPAGTFEGAMGLLANPANTEKLSILNILFTRKFIIMVGILTACVFCYRAFCRFLCPLGAIYGLFARLSVLGVKVEASRCTDCGRCVAACKMDIRRVGDHECIHCGECIGVCPTKAISMKAGKIVLMENETGKPDGQPDAGRAAKRRLRSLLAWAVALAVLAGVIWFVNRDTSAEPVAVTQAEATPEPEDDTPVGKEIGMRCPDFTVPLYGAEGGTYTLGEHQGKVRVLNFWATWCTPCVAELPHFERVQAEYGDRVEILAIHSDMITDDVQAFIDAEGLVLTFAQDETGDVIKSLGGSTQLPMTVIIDQQGKIVYNRVGSMNDETLRTLIDPLM